MAGQVVKGVAGRRSEYRLIQSPLCKSAEPMTVARAIRQHFGFQRLYLADLDPICDSAAPRSFTLYRSLQSEGFEIAVDAGVRTMGDARTMFERGVDQIVVGLETVQDASELHAIVEIVGSSRLIFSLDLRDGIPITSSAWPDPSALGILREAWSIGVRQILLLDLARVGVGQGLGTEHLLRACRSQWPDMSILIGGGVRGAADLHAAARQGADGILVASALHDGRLTNLDIADYR